MRTTPLCQLYLSAHGTKLSYSFFLFNGASVTVWGWRGMSSLFRPYPWIVDFVCSRLLSPCTQQQWRGRKEMFGDLSFFFFSSPFGCLAPVHSSHPTPSHPIPSPPWMFVFVALNQLLPFSFACVCVCCIVSRVVCIGVACLMLCLDDVVLLWCFVVVVCCMFAWCVWMCVVCYAHMSDSTNVE